MSDTFKMEKRSEDTYDHLEREKEDRNAGNKREAVQDTSQLPRRPDQEGFYAELEGTPKHRSQDASNLNSGKTELSLRSAGRNLSKQGAKAVKRKSTAPSRTAFSCSSGKRPSSLILCLLVVSFLLNIGAVIFAGLAFQKANSHDHPVAGSLVKGHSGATVNENFTQGELKQKSNDTKSTVEEVFVHSS